MRYRVIVALFIFTFKLTYAHAEPRSFYETSEHLYMGDQIKLSFDADDANIQAVPLTLSNGLKLTYGEIISISDFYGVLGAPITEANDETTRRARFFAAFNTFAASNDATAEIPRLLDVIHREKEAVDNGLENGEKPEVIFKRIAPEINRQFNCITGGGCSKNGWWLSPGRYMNLSSENFDHFGDNAWQVYQTGHQLALETAVLAHQTHDRHQLELAYVINAYASHFLSDRYASGHMRTPRHQLPDHTTPSIVGNLLVNYMHDEENQYSLHVHNAKGAHWIAYGDQSFFNKNNNENREHLREVLQLSADQIFSAYLTGTMPSSDEVGEYIPHADETPASFNQDISPLFYWDTSTRQLMRRVEMENYYDRHWTNAWWGWSTLLALSKTRGLPDGAQAALAHSEFAEKALQDGLITNKIIAAYIKHQRALAGRAGKRSSEFID